jgi:hypothetical protein
MDVRREAPQPCQLEYLDLLWADDAGKKPVAQISQVGRSLTIAYNTFQKQVFAPQNKLYGRASTQCNGGAAMCGYASANALGDRDGHNTGDRVTAM